MIIRKLLKEASKRQDSKNSHQWHFEDLVVSDREDVEEINDKLNRFKRKLEGDKDAGLNLTNKIDGAPAVVIWHKFPGLPDNSICLKTFMGKNPHVLSSVEDIQREKPYVADKLIPCLELAKYIPAGQAWQGDCLFSKEDLKERKINGKKYLTFLPNTLIYAFGEDNPNYERVKNADFGIAFHTIYTGEVGNLSQSFKVKASDINAPDRFYILSPALSRELDKKDFDTKAIDDLQNKFNSQASKLLSDPAYDIIINNKDLKWAEFENSIIRDKRNPHIDVNTFIEELKEYIANKLEKEYSKKTFKTDKGRENALLKKNDSIARLSNTVEENKQTLINMVNCLNTVIDIKILLLNGFRKYKTNYDTFYHKLSSDEYIPGAPEGEGIAMSDDDGNIVKLVDRPHFSHYNSSNDYESGFMKEELDLYDAFKLLEDVEDRKAAVAIFGKFNPPTRAHRKMIQAISDKAKSIGATPIVFASHKVGGDKHPLSYEDKFKYLKAAFGDLAEVKKSEANSPFQVLHELYLDGYTDVIYFSGPDRIGLKSSIPAYNGPKNDKLSASDYYKFNTVDVEILDFEGSPESEIRATKARQAVKDNDFEKFKTLVPFTENVAQQLFNELRATMGLNEELEEELLDEKFEKIGSVTIEVENEEPKIYDVSFKSGKTFEAAMGSDRLFYLWKNKVVTKINLETQEFNGTSEDITIKPSNDNRHVNFECKFAYRLINIFGVKGTRDKGKQFEDSSIKDPETVQKIIAGLEKAYKKTNPGVKIFELANTDHANPRAFGDENNSRIVAEDFQSSMDNYTNMLTKQMFKPDDPVVGRKIADTEYTINVDGKEKIFYVSQKYGKTTTPINLGINWNKGSDVINIIKDIVTGLTPKEMQLFEAWWGTAGTFNNLVAENIKTGKKLYIWYYIISEDKLQINNLKTFLSNQWGSGYYLAHSDGNNIEVTKIEDIVKNVQNGTIDSAKLTITQSMVAVNIKMTLANGIVQNTEIDLRRKSKTNYSVLSKPTASYEVKRAGEEIKHDELQDYIFSYVSKEETEEHRKSN